MHNPERGEVKFTVGGHEGVLCAEMGRLAMLSSTVEADSISDLMNRINGMELATMFHAVDALVIQGDIKGIKTEMKTPRELGVIMGAILESLSVLWETNPKNEEGGTGKAD